MSTDFFSTFKQLQKTKRGFTLIELLVVIGIIGILSSVILASLSFARQKSRDGKRVAEITQMTRALEIFYDSNQRYPSTTPAGFSGVDAGIQLLASLRFLPSVTPIPPPGANSRYIYHGIYDDGAGVVIECVLAATTCNGYELGITLERTDSPVLPTDADQSVGAFYGGYPDCTVNAPGAELCYDVKGYTQ